MRFWTSIMLAACILLLSTFILGMSALGVDVFAPHNDVDNNVSVNKLVYYFNDSDQEEKQRKFIIAREIGDGSGSAKKEQKQDSSAIPINQNSADAFEAPDTPSSPTNQIVANSQQQKENALEQKKLEEEQKKKAEEEAKQEESAKEAEEKKSEEQKKNVNFTFKINMAAKYTAQVYNTSGQLIKTFYKDSYLDPGEKTVTWDRKDANGALVANGNYIFKVETISPGVPVLIYHHLALGGKGYDENPFTETPENFLKQMDYLAENNYNVITIQDIADFMQGNKMLPPKSVAITFDDGYGSVYNYAFKILKRFNFKATAFVIGKKVEEADRLSKGYVSYVPSLTSQQLREMYQSGIFDIQSHTYNLHDTVQVSPYGTFGQAITAKMYLKNLKRMETDAEYNNRISEDLKKGKELLENAIGTKIVSLAWPHGKSHEKPTQIAKSMDYKYFIEGSIGPNYIGDSVTSIKRVFVKKAITDEAFGRLLNPKPKTILIYTTTAELN